MIAPALLLLSFAVGTLFGLYLFTRFVDFVCNVAANRDAGLGSLFGVEHARRIIATMARQSHLLRWVKPTEIAPEDPRVRVP